MPRPATRAAGWQGVFEEGRLPGEAQTLGRSVTPQAGASERGDERVGVSQAGIVGSRGGCAALEKRPRTSSCLGAALCVSCPVRSPSSFGAPFSQRKRSLPFIWGGLNYLLKMTCDVEFLADLLPPYLRRQLPWRLHRNPFMVPLEEVSVRVKRRRAGKPISAPPVHTSPPKRRHDGSTQRRRDADDEQASTTANGTTVGAQGQPQSKGTSANNVPASAGSASLDPAGGAPAAAVAASSTPPAQDGPVASPSQLSDDSSWTTSSSSTLASSQSLELPYFDRLVAAMRATNQHWQPRRRVLHLQRYTRKLWGGRIRQSMPRSASMWHRWALHAEEKQWGKVFMDDCGRLLPLKDAVAAADATWMSATLHGNTQALTSPLRATQQR